LDNVDILKSWRRYKLLLTGGAIFELSSGGTLIELNAFKILAADSSNSKKAEK
jgi:hypothetical protein